MKTKKEIIDKLNDDAMQIILNAGDARQFMQEAIEKICEDTSWEEIDALMEQAKEKLTAAHIVQTDDIQKSVTQVDQVTCLLFTHAQDTLMTINSELYLTKNLIKLYKHLERKVENV